MKNILILLILNILINGLSGVLHTRGWIDMAIGVRGQVWCNKKPYRAKIELYDYSVTLFPKWLNTTYPTRKGTFEIIGTRVKIDPMDPYVYITHKCGKLRKHCKIQFYKGIPWDGNLYEGTVPEHLFDLGDIELNKYQKDQRKICSGDRLI